MAILSMAMNSKKRMTTIVNATMEQYFQMLNEQKKMSRNERGALEMRGCLLNAEAREDRELHAAWNKAAVETGHSNKVLPHFT